MGTLGREQVRWISIGWASGESLDALSSYGQHSLCLSIFENFYVE